MSNGNIQNKPPVLPEASELPEKKLEYKSDGLAMSKSESSRDSSNKVVYTLLGKLQESNEAIEQIVTNPKPLDNPVKADRIETDKGE